MFSSLRLDVHLCDDGASFLTLKSGQEEVPDASLSILPSVAPSLPTTLKDNIVLFNTFPDPFFPLARSTESELGETFGVGANVDDDDICCELGDILLWCRLFMSLPQGLLEWV